MYVFGIFTEKDQGCQELELSVLDFRVCMQLAI